MKVLERINTQVELIDELVSELKVEASYRGIERLVQVIIQALLDLGLMAIAVLDRRVPKRYSDIGPLLCDVGILGRDYSEVMRGMAGLSSVLVHMYAHVDRDKVIEASRRLASDAVRISRTIYDALKARGLTLRRTYVTRTLKMFWRDLGGCWRVGLRRRTSSVEGLRDIRLRETMI